MAKWQEQALYHLSKKPRLNINQEELEQYLSSLEDIFWFLHVILANEVIQKGVMNVYSTSSVHYSYSHSTVCNG